VPEFFIRLGIIDYLSGDLVSDKAENTCLVNVNYLIIGALPPKFRRKRQREAQSAYRSVLCGIILSKSASVFDRRWNVLSNPMSNFDDCPALADIGRPFGFNIPTTPFAGQGKSIRTGFEPLRRKLVALG
jgi:hypothetical protein